MRKSSIINYLLKEASLSEIDSVNSWRRSSDEAESYVRELSELMDIAMYGESVPDMPFGQVQAKISGRFRRRRRKVAILVSSVAAVIALFFVISTCFNSSSEAKYDDNWAAFDNSGGSEPMFVCLADGTGVFLKEGAVLRVEPEYGFGDRNVYLDGAAHFDVAKMPDNPFMVLSTSSLTVKVTGTSFFMDTKYEGDGFNVALEEGVVSLVRDQNGYRKTSITLSPGYMFTSKDDSFSVDAIPDSYYKRNDFVSDWFTFEDKHFEDVLDALSTVYGIKFYLSSTSLASLRYTGCLKDMAMEDILECFKIMFGIDYSISGSKVFFYEK